MEFSRLIGQDINVRLLKNALRQDRVAHAYLFAGPSGSGKKTLAMALARALNCEHPQLAARDFEPCGECGACRKIASGQHPDVTLIKPDGARLKIEQMRVMQKANAFRAYEGKYKVFVIDRAETMTDQAANSLLKVLEEPLGATIFVLLAENEASVLPTLVSRCVTVAVRPLAEPELTRLLVATEGWPMEKAQLLARLSQGAYGRAVELEPAYDWLVENLKECLAAVGSSDRAKLLELAAGFEKQRGTAESFLDGLSLMYRSRLDSPAGQPGLREIEVALLAIAQTRRAFQSNVNPRLAMEVLFLQLVRCCHGGATFAVYQERL